MKSVEFSTPFPHKIFDDFLTTEEIDQINEIYTSLTFKQISTDLFKFMQTSELSNDKRLKFFIDHLNEIFQQKSDLKDAYYTIFASYYRKGDYLLCHDDMIEERLYAFSYYLKDFKSGELTIYEEDCVTVNKKIDVIENRCVIFEVNQKSFHEVNYCESEGRRAITGWINIKGKKNISKEITKKFNKPNNICFYDIPIDINQGDCIILEFKDILQDIITEKINGPFTDRRVQLLEIKEYHIPRFDGYELMSAVLMKIKKDGYILINDKINDLIEYEVLDVIIFCEGEYAKDFINIVDKSGEILQKFDTHYGYMLIIKRYGRGICIPRTNHTVVFKHFIYKKI